MCMCVIMHDKFSSMLYDNDSGDICLLYQSSLPVCIIKNLNNIAYIIIINKNINLEFPYKIVHLFYTVLTPANICTRKKKVSPYGAHTVITYLLTVQANALKHLMFHI